MRIIIEELRKEWQNGTWKPERKELFMGADLAVSDKLIRVHPSDVLVVTQYAYEFSSVVFELRDRLKEYIDYQNKYEFYPRLGEAANRCIEEGRNEPEALIDAALTEAFTIAEEWDRYLYFAYGSNMDENQMQERCPGAVKVGIDTVEGMRFVLDSAGVASVVPHIGSRVTGVIWLVTKRHGKTLDRYEGVASGCYRLETIYVTIDGARYHAYVYLSNRDTTKPGHRDGYMAKIINAAKHHGFSESYIRELQSWEKE